jgi:hypothetical protein
LNTGNTVGNDGKLVDVQFEHGYGVTHMAWKHMGNYGKYWKMMIDWRISRYRIFRHGYPEERQRLADKAAPQVTAIDILAEVGADLAFPSA